MSTLADQPLPDTGPAAQHAGATDAGAKYDHIRPEYRHVAAWSNDDRIQFTKVPIWIRYPRANDVLQLLDDLLKTPQRPRMPNLLIVGESNNGKTTLVQHFAEAHEGYVDDNDEPVKPVVVAQASTDEKDIYRSVLDRLAAPIKYTATASALRYQAIHMLRYCHTKMLIIDEIHSLLAQPPMKQRQAMNAVKFMCNELRIPVVGVGTSEAVQVLHTDPQHASRFDVAKLPVWPLNKAFQQLLVSFELHLPLRKPSHIHRTAGPVHSICGGNIGDLHRLLTDCAIQAIKSGSEQITMDIIQENSWQRPTRGIRDRPL